MMMIRTAFYGVFTNHRIECTTLSTKKSINRNPFSRCRWWWWLCSNVCFMEVQTPLSRVYMYILIDFPAFLLACSCVDDILMSCFIHSSDVCVCLLRHILANQIFSLILYIHSISLVGVYFLSYAHIHTHPNLNITHTYYVDRQTGKWFIINYWYRWSQ